MNGYGIGQHGYSGAGPASGYGFYGPPVEVVPVWFVGIHESWYSVMSWMQEDIFLAWYDWQKAIRGKSLTIEQRTAILLRYLMEYCDYLCPQQVEEYTQRIIAMEGQLGADQFGHVNMSAQYSAQYSGQYSAGCSAQLSLTTMQGANIAGTMTLSVQQRQQAAQLYWQCLSGSNIDQWTAREVWNQIVNGQSDNVAEYVLRLQQSGIEFSVRQAAIGHLQICVDGQPVTQTEHTQIQVHQQQLQSAQQASVEHGQNAQFQAAAQNQHAVPQPMPGSRESIFRDQMHYQTSYQQPHQQVVQQLQQQPHQPVSQQLNSTQTLNVSNSQRGQHQASTQAPIQFRLPVRATQQVQTTTTTTTTTSSQSESSNQGHQQPQLVQGANLSAQQVQAPQHTQQLPYRQSAQITAGPSSSRSTLHAAVHGQPSSRSQHSGHTMASGSSRPPSESSRASSSSSRQVQSEKRKAREAERAAKRK